MTGASTILALTGASGAVYGLRLAEALLMAGQEVEVLLSTAARTVLARECGLNVQGDGEEVRAAFLKWMGNSAAGIEYRRFRHHGLMDWSSPLASGSAGGRRMVICPCSMGTLAAVAMGLSDNLIERAADVVIKERGQLILVTRETPLSAIHLENMLRLARLGVILLPASPGFYHRPQAIGDLVDFVVARVMDQLGVAHGLISPWGGDMGGR
ncbi:MAG: UbiX family flavin prenyltransferase [Magnetococcales bacterium]|nr:UbiX family flavin prenyltransferase [Magnetococcales bacterium]